MPDSNQFTNHFEHAFAQYALSLYAQPRLARLCLSLQDEQDMDVNLLLWAAWLDEQAVPFDPALWRAGEAAVRYWRAWIIKPLRWLRRNLRPVKGCYQYLKKRELRAEAVAMQRLFNIARQWPMTETKNDGGYTLAYFRQLQCESRWLQWQSTLKGIEQPL